jgi:hypothetical protein
VVNPTWKSIALVLMLITLAACGTELTFTKFKLSVEPPPSDVKTVGTLSGTAHSEGGEHYKTFHTLGSNLGRNIQVSEDGTYESE